MRPLTPVPTTLPRSAPSSRANLRTDGLAWALEKARSSISGRASRGALSALGAAGGARVGAAADVAPGPALDAAPDAARGAGAFPAGGAAAAAALSAVGAGAFAEACAAAGVEAVAGAGAAGLSAGAAAEAGSSNRIKEPSDTLSPVLSLTCAILPATVDGTSMAAFSVSIVTS